jgi:hypothetical protein
MLITGMGNCEFGGFELAVCQIEKSGCLSLIVASRQIAKGGNSYFIGATNFTDLI